MEISKTKFGSILGGVVFIASGAGTIAGAATNMWPAARYVVPAPWSYYDSLAYDLLDYKITKTKGEIRFQERELRDHNEMMAKTQDEKSHSYFERQIDNTKREIERLNVKLKRLEEQQTKS